MPEFSRSYRPCDGRRMKGDAMTPARPGHTLENMVFDNRFVRDLPGDSDPVNARRQVTNASWTIPFKLIFPTGKKDRHRFMNSGSGRSVTGPWTW